MNIHLRARLLTRYHGGQPLLKLPTHCDNLLCRRVRRGWCGIPIQREEYPFKQIAQAQGDPWLEYEKADQMRDKATISKTHNQSDDAHLPIEYRGKYNKDYIDDDPYHP